MIEPILVLEWLDDMLTHDDVLANPDTGIKEWHQIAPATVRSPYAIVRQLTAASDLTALDYGGGGQRVWTPLIMQVIVYDRERENYGRIGVLAERVDALLQAASGTLLEGTIHGSNRTFVNAGIEVVEDATAYFIEQQYTIEAHGEPEGE